MFASSASSALQAAVRGISTTTAASAAVPALASKPSSTGGLFGLFGSARIDVPLSEPLPTSVPPLRTSQPAAAPKLQSGALASGTKVVAVDTPGPVTAISLVYGAGSAHETEATAGISKVLEQLAFKSSSNRTTFRITRELEKLGAVATATAGREALSLTVSAAKLHVPEVTEILLDTALNARLNYWEVQEAITSAKAALTAALQDPTTVVTDALHRAAFDGGLGAPLYPEPSTLDHITKEALAEYLATALTPSSAVLAAAGVGLEDFTSLAGPLVGAGGAAAGKAALVPSSTYLGGSLSVLAGSSPLVHLGLAFEAKGGVADAKGAAAAAVAKALLDGASAVLPRGSQEGAALAGFASLYRSTGLLGLVGTAPASQVGSVVDAASAKLQALAKGVPEPQLKAAKQLVLGAYKAQLGSAAGLAAAAAPQLLLTGKFSPSEYVSAVEALSGAELAGYVAKALKSAPTLVTYGSLAVKPLRYEALAKRFA